MDEDDELAFRRRNSNCMKKWVAWKWRWALEAWKAKTLSHRIKELENGSRELLRSHDNKGQNSNIRTSDNFTSMRSLSKMGTTYNGRNQSDRNSGEETGGLPKVKEMQKQVEKLSSCLNKTMPTLVRLSKQASHEKPPADESNIGFRKCKTFPSKSPRDEKQSVGQGDDRKSITIAFGPTRRNLTAPKGRQPNVPTKASIDSLHKPKPGIEPCSTTKCLQTLQVSVHDELKELQDLLSSGIGILQRKKAMGSYNALVSVWEVSDNVAQLLSKARQVLEWCRNHQPGLRGSTGSQVPSTRAQSPSSNRHRVPCHTIPEDKPNGSSPRVRVNATSASGSGQAQAQAQEQGLGLGQGLRLGLEQGLGQRWFQSRDPPWQGRMCAAAEHASKLQEQIERLQLRHRAISSCLGSSHGPPPRFRLPPRSSIPTTTLTFM